ncbi:MAG: hypothetical protein WDZ82_03200 [Candidatus Paceibacterota bacterium]
MARSPQSTHTLVHSHPDLPEKLEWSTLEHEHLNKTADWYWAVGLIALSIAMASIIFGNFLFAILIVIAAIALMIQSLNGPAEMNIAITSRGVVINKKLYPFNTLESFWVENDEESQEGPKLLAKSHKILMPLIVIPINEEEVDPEDVTDYMLDFVDEEELFEPLSQKIMEWMGF